jgi:hypothetical protein
MQARVFWDVIPSLFVLMRFLRSPFLASMDITTQTRVLMTNRGDDWPCFAAEINAIFYVSLCIGSACAGVQPLGATGMY